MVSLERLDKHFRSLLKSLKLVAEAKSKTEISLDGIPNPMLNCLYKYIRAYDVACKDDPTGVRFFLDEFYRIYKENRTRILNSDFKWLKTTIICIKFGEGVQNSRRDIQIMLSKIYQSACDLKSQAELKLEGLPDKEWESCDELNYPDILLLHLYRIFKELCPEDGESLNRLIGLIETNLRIVNSSTGNTGMLSGLNGLINVMSSVASGNEMTASSAANNPNDLLNSLGDLGGLGKIISPLMSTLGKAMNGNDSSDIGAMLNNLDLNSLIGNLTNTLKEPGTQNSLQSALSQLQNSPEIGNLMSNVGRMLDGTSAPDAPTDSTNLMLGPPSIAIPVNTLFTTAMTAFTQCEKKMISSKEESYI